MTIDPIVHRQLSRLRVLMCLQVCLLFTATTAPYVFSIVSAKFGGFRFLPFWPFYMSAILGGISLFSVCRAQLHCFKQAAHCETVSVRGSNWSELAILAALGSGVALMYGAYCAFLVGKADTSWLTNLLQALGHATILKGAFGLSVICVVYFAILTINAEVDFESYLAKSQPHIYAELTRDIFSTRAVGRYCTFRRYREVPDPILHQKGGRANVLKFALVAMLLLAMYVFFSAFDGH